MIIYYDDEAKINSSSMLLFVSALIHALLAYLIS